MTSQLEAPERDQSMVKLVGGIIEDTEQLVKQQVDLFKVDIKHDARQMALASIPMVAGAITCLVGAIVLAFALGHGLIAIWPNLPVWGAYLIVGLLTIAGGALAIWLGKQQFTEPIREALEPAAKEVPQWTTK